MAKTGHALSADAPMNQIQAYEDAVLKGFDPTGISAQHYFRQQIQRSLPGIAGIVTKFLMTRPISVAQPNGNMVQMVPDADALTKDQVKLASVLLAKMLPGYIPENFDGSKAAQMPSVVKVSITQVGADVDLTKMPGNPVSTAHQAMAKKTSLITINKNGVQIGIEDQAPAPEVKMHDAGVAQVIDVNPETGETE